jgi:hypothetical protein
LRASGALRSDALRIDSIRLFDTPFRCHLRGSFATAEEYAGQNRQHLNSRVFHRQSRLGQVLLVRRGKGQISFPM